VERHVVDIFLCAAKMMTRGRLRSMQQDPVSRLRGCPSPGALNSTATPCVTACTTGCPFASLMIF
jgi:hypothetical protein